MSSKQVSLISFFILSAELYSICNNPLQFIIIAISLLVFVFTTSYCTQEYILREAKRVIALELIRYDKRRKEREKDTL